jgi:hypothetical protein
MELMSYQAYLLSEITGCTGCTMESRDISGQILLLEFQQAMIQAAMDKQDAIDAKKLKVAA